MKLRDIIFWYQIFPDKLSFYINEVKIYETEILRFDFFILISILVYKQIKLDSKNKSTNNSNNGISLH